jgi:hypothetical protein
MRGMRLGQHLAERLQDLVLESDDVRGFLEELSVFSARLIGKATGQPLLSAVTLVRQRRSLTAAGSSAEAGLLDEVQNGSGQNPSLESLETRTTMSVADVRADTRWRRHSRAVARLGQRSVLAVPLTLDEGSAASMTFFAPEADAFHGEAIVICEAFAARAGKAVRLAVRVGASKDLNDDLLEAMKSRTSINLASGIVMGQSRCSQAEAFAILTKVSSNRNVKLRIVAEELLRNFDKSPGATHFDD